MKDEDDQLYMYQLYGVSTPRIIKASKDLRHKIGAGAGITPKQIQQAQDFIENSGLDYSEQALKYIKELDGVVQMLRTSPYDRESSYNDVSMPIMQIKGQAGMFGNHLASELSYIVLLFLEKFQRLDDNVLNIMDIYIKAIRLSYGQKLFTLDSEGGQQIAKELDLALQRYQKRYIDMIEK